MSAMKKSNWLILPRFLLPAVYRRELKQRGSSEALAKEDKEAMEDEHFLKAARSPQLKLSGLIFIGVVLVDLASKYLVKERVIQLEVIQNPGLPFFGKVFPGFFDLAIIVFALVFFVLFYSKYFSTDNSLGFPLIIGGAVANLIDRLDDGAVVDFIDIGLGGSFNFADIAIWTGIVVLIFQVLTEKKVKRA